MSVLANTQQQIANTNALLAREEQALADHPEESVTILQSIASLTKLKRQLEEDFASIADSLGRDICSYRLVSEEGRAHITSWATALAAFQKAVSVVYDALKTGPKQRARVSAEVAEESAFDLGYTFVGSTGFVLTIPNERLLGIETDLDNAIHTVFELADSKNPEDVAAHVSQLGHGPVRAMRSWVDSHVRNGLGADIHWQRGAETREALLIQHPELLALRTTIDTTSSETETRFETIGELVAANLPGKSFRMHPEQGDPIKGRFSDAISEAHTVRIPCTYRAAITKTVRVNYATDDEQASFFLERLDEVT